MKRGTITILIILVVAVTAAVFSLVYHYRNQARAQEFWGATTALLIDKGPSVEVLALGDPDTSISLEDEDSFEEPPRQPAADDKPPVVAVEFNQVPWIVQETKDAADAKGIANLRRALVVDTTFDWTPPPDEPKPDWNYGLAVNDGRNWVTVLFDFDSRQVGLSGGRKTVLLEPQANDDFRQFFQEQFAEQRADKSSESKVDDPADDPADAKSTGPGEKAAAPDDEPPEAQDATEAPSDEADAKVPPEGESP